MNPIHYENLAEVNKSYRIQIQEFIDNFLSKGTFILGEEVSNFETEFADFIDSKFCIGVGNGLDAMVLALKAKEYPKNTEVIVAANTYIATILAIILAGHKPVLVEPDAKTYNIDPSRIEYSITKNTKAILVTHLYGNPCEMSTIQDICSRYELDLFEDCAQSTGTEYKGVKTGNFGTGCFSFYPTKNLGAMGDAGCITTSNETYANKLKALRNYGSEKKYVNMYIGHNSRLDPIQAGILRIKLKGLDKYIQTKRDLASIYFNNLDRSKYQLPIEDDNYYSTYHIFNILCKNRSVLQKKLLDMGIHTEIHYPVAPYKQKAFKNLFKNQNFPISDFIHENTLSLPISTYHSQNDIRIVVEALNHS